ncbi:hypothetical protein SRL2020028_24020 [Mycobacterium kiyosense]|uniref:Monooxygenase n=1 Tax=Mycobacterium kiyosense TaxID=2871094 RepID=A0AA37UY24_9MYCO|nr:hypothetical protein SRL2020028_24020 [Mycobacterium kiyosense]
MIIGAGFAGVAMAHRLKKDGFTNFTILEKAADIGGVWRDNTYPGAACDVPSALYSLSYTPNPRWSRRYAEQPEILEYLQRLVESGGLDAHLRTQTEVVDLTFDEQSGRWTLATSSNETICCDVVVSAVGQLSLPHIPDIADADTFQGPRFHSARWDRSVSLRGKQVAVIGTGASAIQFVPHIAREAEHVTLYQRTAPWILPKWDSRYGVLHYRVSELLPMAQRLERFAVWLLFELLAVTLVDAKPLSRVLGAIARRHLHRQVASPSLREQLTPSDAPGCKRVLFSNDYYPAIASDRVSLVPKAIAELCDKGVKTVDGEFRPADVVIYGTGFRATDFLAPMSVRGSRGVSLAEVWKTQAYASGHHCPHVPEPVPALWSQHECGLGVDPLHDRVTSPSHHNAHQGRGCSSGSCGRGQVRDRATLQHALEKATTEVGVGAVCELVSNLEWGNPDELAGAYLGLSNPHAEAAQRRLRLEKGRASKGRRPRCTESAGS